MKKYQVSKHFYLTIVFLLIGLIALGIYWFQARRISNAVDYVTENCEKIKKGKIVRIVIDQYLYAERGSIPINLNGVNYLNVPVSSIPRQPAGEIKRYVLLGINGKNSVQKLSEYQEGRGMPITIFAKTEPFRLADFRWYEMNVPEFDLDFLIQTRELREVNLEDYLPFLIAGVASIVLSLISFLTIGRIKVVYVRPFEDSSDYKDCYLGRGYDLEKRYEKEQENVKIYHKQMQESWKSLCVGGVLFFGGILLILACWFLGLVILPVAIVFYAVGIPVGIYAMLASLRWFWEGFINSDLELAYRIADTCMLRTPAIKLDESSKLIAALKKHVEGKPKEEVRMWYGPGVWEEKETEGAAKPEMADAPENVE